MAVITLHMVFILLSMFCLQDAINMQINNLARDNLHDKLDILSDLVTDEYWPWFANYMVVKRAAQVSLSLSHAPALASDSICTLPISLTLPEIDVAKHGPCLCDQLHTSVLLVCMSLRC